MTAKQNTIRVLGRIEQEQWQRWQAAASRLGLTFTAFAKLCLDMHSQIITTEEQPRRKLPRKVSNAKRAAKK